MQEVDLRELRLAQFEALVDCDIEVDFGAGPVAAAVIGARAIGGHTPRPDGGFSVMLLAASGVPPRQGSFRVQHPALGSMTLFMSPRRQVGDRVEFEIVFN